MRVAAQASTDKRVLGGLQRGLTCAAAASGKSHQCTDWGASGGSARRRFWYSASQKKGVKGAITCAPRQTLLLLSRLDFSQRV